MHLRLDYDCDPYLNPIIYDAEKPITKQPTKMPFPDCAKRTTSTERHKNDNTRQQATVQSPQNFPAITNEIRVAKAVSPSSSETTEHHNLRTTTKQGHI